MPPALRSKRGAPYVSPPVVSPLAELLLALLILATVSWIRLLIRLFRATAGKIVARMLRAWARSQQRAVAAAAATCARVGVPVLQAQLPPHWAPTADGSSLVPLDGDRRAALERRDVVDNFINWMGEAQVVSVLRVQQPAVYRAYQRRKAEIVAEGGVADRVAYHGPSGTPLHLIHGPQSIGFDPAAGRALSGSAAQQTSAVKTAAVAATTGFFWLTCHSSLTRCCPDTFGLL